MIDPGFVAPSAPPTGTVTFFFTDIEGSTQRWERFPEAMRRALRRHDEILRGVIVEAGGYVFKTIGDAFCAVFDRASDAAQAAVAVQRRLAADDWSEVDGMRVRIAIHTGVTDERSGDYFGPTVNRVARLLGIASGEQIVLSEVAKTLVAEARPPTLSFVDLGPQRLKDLTSPEHVYQLVAPGLRATFPPLRSLDAIPNNLPRQMTSFIGREDVVAELEALLAEAPLVTLVGTGGIGKTRTALQVAANLLDSNADGVWFADLAPIADAGLVGGVLCAVVGVNKTSDHSALDALLPALKNRSFLLLIDNCEHVIEEVAQLATALLNHCPRGRLLATSREALSVSGERVYRMPTLPTPPPGVPVTAADAGTYGSLALFAERAHAADGRFRLTDANAPIVADICRRLDGIALAIELAAPRVKVLAVQQLSQRLDERFRLLTGGNRTALPRQQTMRALIDWSYDLLSEEERTVFRRASTFSGGWTLDAASDICADDALESWDVMDLLAALVDKSLVVCEPSGNERRYRFLESIRQYARERLAESGEADGIAKKHAAFFGAFAQEAERAWWSATERAWLASFAPEIDNVRAALATALRDRSDVELAAAIVGALYRLFDLMSLGDEGLSWCHAVLSSGVMLSPLVEARLTYALGLLLFNNGQWQKAVGVRERCITLFRKTDDPRGLTMALMTYASQLAAAASYDEARVPAEEAVRLARDVGDRFLVARALQYFAWTFEPAALESARASFAESASIFRSLGRERETANVLIWWADVEAKCGNFARALELSRESLLVSNPRDTLLNHCNIAGYALALGDAREAAPAARRALELGLELQRPLFTAFALQYLAAVAGADGRHPLAARLAGYADARLGQLEAARSATEQVPRDMLLAALSERLGETALHELLREGALWTEDDAVRAAAEVGD